MSEQELNIADMGSVEDDQEIILKNTPITFDHSKETIPEILGLSNDTVVGMATTGDDRVSYAISMLMSLSRIGNEMGVTAHTVSIMTGKDCTKPSQLVEHMYTTLDDDKLFALCESWGNVAQRASVLDSQSEEVSQDLE